MFAFFGYNESFGGDAGLPFFRDDLIDFVEHTRMHRYDGESPPRLVLFSPIAHEDLGRPGSPDVRASNARLLTVNGAHLTGDGNRKLAEIATAPPMATRPTAAAAA